MTGRWCNVRQAMIEAARMLVDSDGCTYGLKQLEGAEKAAKVEELLHKEAFHFGKKANSVSHS
jgi:hypothetical protein